MILMYILCHALQSRTGSPEPENKRDSTGSSSSTMARQHGKKIRGLASAILQLAQMVDEKFFKAPLGEDEKEKKKRLKKEEEKKKKVRVRFHTYFNLSFSNS